MIIGTFLPECLHSLVSALKFDGVNPAPDMTKRKTASKLITRGSWPSARKAIVNVSLTRSNTSLKELNFCLVMQGLSLPQYNGLRGHVSGCFFFAFFRIKINVQYFVQNRIRMSNCFISGIYIMLFPPKTYRVVLW